MSLISKLRQLPARFIGEGINHEGLVFQGHIDLQALPGDHSCVLTYRAFDSDGQLLHHEVTLLVHLQDGSACLWPVMAEPSHPATACTPRWRYGSALFQRIDKPG